MGGKHARRAGDTRRRFAFVKKRSPPMPVGLGWSRAGTNKYESTPGRLEVPPPPGEEWVAVMGWIRPYLTWPRPLKSDPANQPVLPLSYRSPVLWSCHCRRLINPHLPCLTDVGGSHAVVVEAFKRAFKEAFKELLRDATRRGHPERPPMAEPGVLPSGSTVSVSTESVSG